MKQLTQLALLTSAVIGFFAMALSNEWTAAAILFATVAWLAHQDTE